MLMYLIISHKSHFQLQAWLMYAVQIIVTTHKQAYEIADFIRFKAPLTSFDLCKQLHLTTVLPITKHSFRFHCVFLSPDTFLAQEF